MVKSKLRKNTAISEFMDALHKGEQFSAIDMTYIFGIANPTATISYLRNRGYPIYSNKRKTGNNAGQTLYKLGKPRKLLLSIGYRVLGASIYK